jgi:hypothetical protein
LYFLQKFITLKKGVLLYSLLSVFIMIPIFPHNQINSGNDSASDFPKPRIPGPNILFIIITMVLLALPAILYFSQKNPIADIRSRANPYNGNACDICTQNAADCTDPPPQGLGGSKGTGTNCSSSLFCCSLPSAPSPTAIHPTPTSTNCIGAHNCKVVTLDQCSKDGSCNGDTTKTFQYQLCYDTNNEAIKCFYRCEDDSSCMNITPTPTNITCYWVTNNQCGFHCSCDETDVADKYCDTVPVSYWGSRCDSTTGVNCCSGPSNTPKPNSPTPTSPPISACLNVKIYKNDVVVDPTTLRTGDIIILAVKGTEDTIKAHFRINGTQLPGDSDTDPNWTESITTNSAGEYISVPYTIQSGTIHILIEAEIYANNAWY